MTITKDDAAQALGEVTAARRRVRETLTYGYVAPYLIIWGLVWLVADIGTQLAPHGPLQTWVWPVGSAVGVASSLGVVIAQQRRKPSTSLTHPWLRVFASLAAIWGFCLSMSFVFQPMSPKQAHSFFGLFAGFAYLLLGLWLGSRLILLGLALIALTLFGFYCLPLSGGYLAFMGLVGGGAFILGGAWLRRL